MHAFGTLLAAVALPFLALIPLPSTPSRYVTDAAGVLDDRREAALNEQLAFFERQTSNQLLVYVDRNVPAGTTLEEMSAEAIRTWRVGQAKQDNGAILFLFVDSRDSRLEVGYGLEGTLTDALSKRILVDLRPALRNGDYTTAVEQGANQVIAAISNPQAAQQPLVPDEASRQAAIEARAAEIAAKEPGTPALIAITFFMGMLVVLILIARKKSGISWNSGSSSSPGRSSSSSSSSSSSFRGGGGSGGGGGASDKW